MVEDIKRAVEQGDAEAQWRLGLEYSMGNIGSCGEEGEKLAGSWFRNKS